MTDFSPTTHADTHAVEDIVAGVLRQLEDVDIREATEADDEHVIETLAIATIVCRRLQGEVERRGLGELLAAVEARLGGVS